MAKSSDDRAAALHKARRLEYFTICWNSLEALGSLFAGMLSGSIVLVGFGLESVIETGSGLTLLWRFRHANEATSAQRSGGLTLRRRFLRRRLP